ncbi:MAG: molecular chaperone HtpG, partial [Hyphomicrobiales bacterium]|nr:molecular chaperone HtpG [Hyphomicrobiales bacterium]
MVHSVYSDRSVFLRELVSNAADACEKLRYEALTTPDLAPPDGYAIRVSLDPEAKTLEVADDGIGMSHDDLVHALGAIARSGTRAFLDKLTAEEAGKEGARLIGQFGIGFYSSFMVASSVEVVSRRAGDEATWVWRSQGGGDYEIAPAGEGERLARAGTRVRLSIKDEADEFLDAWRIEDLLREHSGAVAVPIDLVAKPGEAPKRTSDGAALWLKPKSEVTEEAYADFFKTLSGQVDAPALTVHWHAEGRQEFTALAFVPAARPLDLFDPERKGRGKLYVRRVLIDGEASLLPGWLRFVKIVVDSADLPLNVSREMIQESPLLAAIRRAVATRILSELVKCAENDGDKFTKIW